jgi:hypothetical protein
MHRWAAGGCIGSGDVVGAVVGAAVAGRHGRCLGLVALVVGKAARHTQRTNGVLALVGALVGDLVELGGATWRGDLVAALLPSRKKSQRPLRACKANTNRTHLMERHIG